MALHWRLRTVALVAVVLFLGGCLIRPGQTDTRLTYQLPTTLTVPVGQAVPGTDIVYESLADQGAYLRIQGQRALKRAGDSVSWKGAPIEGVSVNLALRVLSFSPTELRLVGTVKIVVEGTQPTAGVIHTTSPLHFSGPVAYGVGQGARIPGTTVTYEGQTEDGAKLGGVEEYPFRKTGDSILWEGSLRSNVYIRLELRAVQFDDRGLRVAGLATLWLGD
jgi:hypothetical protein